MKKLIIESESPEVTILSFDMTDYYAAEKYKRMITVDDAYNCISDIDDFCRSIDRYPPESWSAEQVDFAYDIQLKIRNIIAEAKLQEC